MSYVTCRHCGERVLPRLIRHTPAWVWFLVLGLAILSVASCALSYFVAVLLWIAVGVAVIGWGCLFIFEIVQVCPYCRSAIGREW